MADALAATEMVLAREQQLHALDGLAAAAAHELGTPLSTITVVAKELARETPPGSQLGRGHRAAADAGRALPRDPEEADARPTEPDPLHARMSVTQLLEEAAAPYRGFSVQIRHHGIAPSRAAKAAPSQRAGRRAPARRHLRPRQSHRERRRLRPRAGGRSPPAGRRATSRSTIADDGPGVPADIMDALGEPYITTRPAAAAAALTKDGEPRAWASASSSPRRCWSAPAPPSRWTTASRRTPVRW